MKVVINKCYGGYGLSARAVQRIAELQGRPCYFTRRDWRKGIDADPTATTLEDIEKDESRIPDWDAWDVPLDEVLKHKQPSSEWHSWTEEQKEASNRWYQEHSHSVRPDDRADANLVRAVEELGDAANGSCAELRIVEIPDGIDWGIDEYDGIEHIEERHRTWG